MSFFGRCSACHNTILALVATVAGTSPLFNSAVSSVRSSIVNSTPEVNNTAGQTDVKLTESHDTSGIWDLPIGL